jgi:RIO kinase 1
MSYRDYEPVDLARAGFKIHQLQGFEKDNIENAFAGYVLEVLGKINDGKEATVYLCRAGDSAAQFHFAAAKIFKPRNFRHFNTDKNYRNFGKMRDKRAARHMRGKSQGGQIAFHRQWVQSEWRVLNQLHDLGIRVPEPISQYDDGVLMEYIGTAEGAAPRLINCKLKDEELRRTADKLYDDIETMLNNNIVHGDLSPYNVLHDGKEPVIIDVPQAMNLFEVPDAYSMMHRDLSNLERYFEKQKLQVPFLDLLRNL